jgi:hypothetical protein
VACAITRGGRGSIAYWREDARLLRTKNGPLDVSGPGLQREMR